MASNRPAKLRVAHTWEEVDRLRLGEAVRLGPELKLRSVVAEDYACGSCGYSFTLAAPETPKFCPRCGDRWNGKAAAAVEEAE